MSYHVSYGIKFEREDGGTVRIYRDVNFDKPGLDEFGVTILRLDSLEWASVVAAMSASGETQSTYLAARALHEGRMEAFTKKDGP